MRKNITVAGKQTTRTFAEKKYTVGLDLGDRWGWYCVLDERGEVVFEHKVSTTPKAPNYAKRCWRNSSAVITLIVPQKPTSESFASSRGIFTSRRTSSDPSKSGSIRPI